jgi:hypothetical protein
VGAQLIGLDRLYTIPLLLLLAGGTFSCTAGALVGATERRTRAS